MPVLRFWNGTAWADLAAGLGVPPGGTTGQVLSKKSTTDYDTQWATPSAGGTNVLQVYEANAVTGATVTLPVTPTSVTTVSLNGQLLQQTRDWTISGSVITFTTALTADDVHVEYLTGPYTGSNADQVDGIDAVPASAPAAGKLVATDSYAKLPPSILTPMANLLTNGGFENWQRGNGPFTTNVWTSDRWGIALAGTDTLSLSRVAGAAGIASYWAAGVTFTLGTGGGATAVYQQISRSADNANLQGKTISFSIWVNSATNGAVRAYINTTGTGGVQTSSTTSVVGTQVLTVTAPVPNDMVTGNVGVQFLASATVYLDNAMLVIGPEPVDYLPMHPADDLARCLRYYEIVASGTGPATVGQAQSTTQAQMILVFSQKAVAATLTISANSDFQLLSAAGGALLCTGFALQNTTVNRMQVLASVASGLVAGNATYMGGINANSKMMLEANP